MAMLIEPGRTFVDDSNRILTGGTITFAQPGTGSVTLKATYPTNADLLATTNANANPISFNSAGRMPVAAHGSGSYRVIVKNSLGTTIYDISDVSVFDASTISFTPSSGATATDVQTFLRTEYSKSSAESGASLTITNYGYRRGDVRRYGSVDAANDSTTGFTRAALVAATHPTIIPSGTWNISSATFTDGATIITDGFSTIIKQIAGYDGAPNTQTALIKLAGSNIAFALNGVKVMGQIATDSGEHNHGVMIYKTGASIRNIQIGPVWGVDIRGDVVYVGAPSGYTTTGVKLGQVTYDNCYRHGVAVVGAVGIEGGRIQPGSDGRLGMCALDIEPDNDPSTDIYFESVKGCTVQVAPPNASDRCRRIEIGRMDLNPAHSAESSPAYSAPIREWALSLRNISDLRIGSFQAEDHDDHAIIHTFNVGEASDQRLFIGHMRVINVGAGEAVYNSPIVVSNMTYVKIDSMEVELDAVGDYALYGDPAGVKTKFDIGHAVVDGTLVRYAKDSTFRRVTVNTANDVYLFRDMVNSLVETSTITIPRLLLTGSNSTFKNVNATLATTILGGTCTDIDFENCGGTLEPISSPSQITSNQNDYTIADGVQVLRLSTDASRDVTGITGGRKGRVLRIFNIGAQDLVLKNEAAGSTAANRIALGADLTIGAGEGAGLMYDSTSSRWRCFTRV